MLLQYFISNLIAFDITGGQGGEDKKTANITISQHGTKKYTDTLEMLSGHIEKELENDFDPNNANHINTINLLYSDIDKTTQALLSLTKNDMDNIKTYSDLLNVLEKEIGRISAEESLNLKDITPNISPQNINALDSLIETLQYKPKNNNPNEASEEALTVDEIINGTDNTPNKLKYDLTADTITRYADTLKFLYERPDMAKDILSSLGGDKGENAVIIQNIKTYSDLLNVLEKGIQQPSVGQQLLNEKIYLGKMKRINQMDNSLNDEKAEEIRNSEPMTYESSKQEHLEKDAETTINKTTKEAHEILEKLLPKSSNQAASKEDFAKVLRENKVGEMEELTEDIKSKIHKAILGSGKNEEAYTILNTFLPNSRDITTSIKAFTDIMERRELGGDRVELSDIDKKQIKYAVEHPKEYLKSKGIAFEEKSTYHQDKIEAEKPKKNQDIEQKADAKKSWKDKIKDFLKRDNSRSM